MDLAVIASDILVLMATFVRSLQNVQSLSARREEESNKLLKTLISGSNSILVS